jgi:hypothetical protein
MVTSTTPPQPVNIEEKVQEVLRILVSRNVPSICPRCGQNNWRAELVGFFVSSLPAGVLPKGHIPALMLTCNVCGNTVIHNLNVLGVKI